jgi:hypothetical protein
MKFTSKAIIFSLSLISGVALTWLASSSLFFSTFDGGPEDYQPRLEASAVSPDNGMTVKIYRQRDPAYSRYRGACVFIQVYDKQGKVLYRNEFGSDGAWSELDSKYEISFGGDEIRVTRLSCPRCGPIPSYKIMRMSELRASQP